MKKQHTSPASSPVDQAETLLRQGIAAWEEGRYTEAYRAFKRCLRQVPDHSQAQSYLGLVEIRAHGNGQYGLEMAEEAARRAPRDPVVQLNLGLARIATYDKHRGVPALRRALELDPDCAPARRALERAGLRRRPPLPFLPRGHLLNVLVGKALHRLRGPMDCH